MLLVTAPAAGLGAFNYSTLTALIGYLGSDASAGMFFGLPINVRLVNGTALVGFVMAILMHTIAAGFDARGTRTSTNPNDIHRNLESEWSESEYLEYQLDRYVDRIDQNDRVLNELENMLTIWKFGLAVLMMAALSLISLTVIGPIEQGWIPAVFLLSLIVYRRVPEAYDRADSGGKFTPPYGTDYESRLSRLSDDDEEATDVDSEADNSEQTEDQ